MYLGKGCESVLRVSILTEQMEWAGDALVQDSTL